MRVSFTVKVSVRVIQVAILSCNCEATQQRPTIKGVAMDTEPYPVVAGL